MTAAASVAAASLVSALDTPLLKWSLGMANTTVAASINSTSVDWSADAIRLHDFDRTRFYQVMIVYAAPCAVALLVSHTAQRRRSKCAKKASRVIDLPL